MKLLKIMKDGGPESRVWGFFLVEIKSLLSVVLLHFHKGARDSYHTHAFNAISWLLRGKLIEYHMNGTVVEYTPSFRPIITPRETFHKVVSVGDSYAITFRGPWVKNWKEYLPDQNAFIGLTNHRKVTWQKPAFA